jgi:DNA invertase Pin-like site-specific DNA recombinase
MDEAQAWVLRHPELDLELVDTLKPDEGVSAWKSKNSKNGNLADFLALVDDGTIEATSYFIVENLDRLSRDDIDLAMDLFKLINKRLFIVTTKDGRIYPPMAYKDTMNWIMISLLFSRSAEESQMKSWRCKKAWADRKLKAVEDNQLIGEMLPGWCHRWKDDAKRGQLIPEHAATVRRIVDEFLSGKGTWTIAKNLNKDNVKTFGDGAKWWDESVRRVLGNPALFGMYDGNTTYFPAIITLDEWNDIQQLRSTTHKPKTKSAPLINCLSSVARCCLCGGLLSRMVKHGRSRLVCLAWKTGKTDHAYYAIDMDKAVDIALNLLPHFLSEQPVGDTGMDEELFDLNREVTACQLQIDRLIQAVADGVLADDAVKDKIGSLTASKKVLLASLKEAEETALLLSPATQKRHRRELLNEVLAVPYLSDDGFQARRDLSKTDITALNTKLRLVVQSITFEKNGAVKDYQFLGSPAARVEDAQTTVEALTAQTLGEEAGLRRPRRLLII